ncbi:MAG: hypothetical protein AWU55_267 [Halomonadaceae bacterium T82-2]|nr:MAG: hypothetical protein AWU55_267 [Halomonadaceae bacterium T82-2]
MMEQRLKLWVGIGMTTFLGAGGQAALAHSSDPAADESHKAEMAVESGGERHHGGEGDESRHGGEGSESHHGGEGGESHHGGEGGESDHGGEGGESGHGGKGGEAHHGGEGGESGHGGEGGEGGSVGFVFSHFPVAVSEGGEGGEGGDQPAPSALTSPGIYYTELALMEGHLASAEALYRSGHGDQGAAHLTHPLIEQYPKLESALEAHGEEAPLESALEALSDKAGQTADWEQLAPAVAKARQAIDAAQADVAAETRQSPRFIGDVTLALLKQAAAEYEEAVKDGRFANAAEYQDGRGFVQVATQLWQAGADTLGGADGKVYTKGQAELEELSRIWPEAVPPAEPVKAPGEVYAEVARFELATSALRH